MRRIITVTFDNDTYKYLDLLCKKYCVDRSSMLRFCISSYLDFHVNYDTIEVVDSDFGKLQFSE